MRTDCKWPFDQFTVQTRLKKLKGIERYFLVRVALTALRASVSVEEQA
jgi:hypothetical protein